MSTSVSFGRAVWLAMRPKTLTAALVPVLVGSAFAFQIHKQWSAAVLILAIFSATCIQIGTNFFNDALDFVKGADTGTRLGEARATQSGWMNAKTTNLVGVSFFAAALIAGIPLVIWGGWPIVAIGLFSLLMGYLYTGGPYPLAYVGLGDLFVLIFFGWIAVGGTVYLHSGVFDEATFVLGTQVGLLATVLIAINNIRDQNQDVLVGKKTFAVRLGRFSKWEVPLLYTAFFLLNFYWALKGHWFAFLMSFALIFPAVKLSTAVWKTPPGVEYNKFLARSSMIHILFALVFSVGLSL